MHCGAYKKSMLPEGVTVKAAAEMPGVGRPTLCNLLNAIASLSPEMALRLERAFGVKKEALMKMPAAYDELQILDLEREIAVRAYAH